MHFIDLLKLSTRMFRARTSRTILTVLGMGVGISAILFLVSLGYGLQKTLLEKITTSDSLLTLDVSASESAILNREAVEKIKSIDGVEEVSESTTFPAQGQVDDLSADFNVVITQPLFFRLGGYKIAEGESLSDSNKEGVVVSSSVPKLFGKDNASIMGKDIRFSFFIPESGSESSDNIQANSQKITSDKVYKIIGIIESEDNIVYLHSDSAGEVSLDKFDQLKVKCASNQKMNSVRDEISNEGFSVSSLSDTIDQANKIFRLVQVVLMCFGIIALVVSAIGMFNTMTIALLERTNELGIMKSIGASDLAVSMMFIIESAIMGFLGGLGGVLIGLSEGMISNVLINFVAIRMGGQAVNLFYVPGWFIALVIFFAAFVGLLTGIIPARRASKIDPLDALRYK